MLKNKLFLPLALLLSTTQGFANDFWGKTRYSATIGVNITNFYNKDGNTASKLLPSVGVNAQHYFQEVNKGLNLQVGLHYSPVGYNVESSGTIQEAITGYFYMKNKTMAHYLIIPAQIGYQLPIGRSAAFLPAVGVYAGYGLGGAYDSYNRSSTGEERQIEGKTFDIINRFDAGINVSVGFQFAQRFRLGLDSKIGLVDLTKHDMGAKLHTKRWGLTATYVF